ncbi:MAG: hypothetical protein M2R45_02069 [Verrucomicrobia subdivision 3 bacterium]|nr:hypothetical protein [Limisphaerales bacterium]MCS1413872.1 hypothetical protein [Limisphaerales bacterium]
MTAQTTAQLFGGLLVTSWILIPSYYEGKLKDRKYRADISEIQIEEIKAVQVDDNNTVLAFVFTIDSNMILFCRPIEQIIDTPKPLDGSFFYDLNINKREIVELYKDKQGNYRKNIIVSDFN